MSQNSDYAWVTAVQAQTFQNLLGPVIAQALAGAPIEVAAGVRSCGAASRSAEGVALAPSALKTIQTDYKGFTEAAAAHVVAGAGQVKVAALATLVSNAGAIMVSAPERVTEALGRVIAAGTVREAKREVRECFAEIRSQHQHMFVTNVAEAVKASAAAVGFAQAEVTRAEDGQVRVVTTNPRGQNLIAEIGSGREVDIRAELLGFTDGSCAAVMKAFNDEMASRGIKAASLEVRPTHGLALTPFAKTLSKTRRKGSRRVFADQPSSELAVPETITIKR